MRQRFLILSIIVVLLFFADLLLGSVTISLGDIFSSDDSITHRIVMNYRLPKAIVAVIAGAALSLSGVVMQTVFRNPLAGPYVLGVSSGASLGVAIFLLGGPLLGVTFAADLGIALSAFIGAATVLFIVLAVSVRLRDIMAVLILGMMLSSAAAAFVDVMQFFSSEAALKGFVVWAMGSVGGASMTQISIMAGAVGVGLVITITNIKSLDAMLLGENYARTLGIPIQKVRMWLFVATSLLAGGVTAFCGPIAFIGIAVPHITRMMLRTASHKHLIIGSMLTGAALMLLCDIIAGVPGTQIILPINTVTSLFGIPVVIMVVIKSRRNRIM